MRLVLVLALGLAACGGAPAPPVKSVQLNATGAPVDIEAALPDGYVTVVDFWAEWCHACGPAGDKLAAGVAKDARIVIRKVDVGEGITPVAEKYAISSLPHFRIYDRRKRLRFDLVGPDCERAVEYAEQLAAER